MKSSINVYNYLLWSDHEYNLKKVVIGYKDRFEGILEIKFNDFKTLDTDNFCIPWHRIYYFAIISNDNEQIMLWDRNTKYSVFEK